MNMSDQEKVVFLAFRNDNLQTENQSRELLSCVACKNKTWIVVYPQHKQFPSLVCAVCTLDAGQIGWSTEEE